MPFIQASSKSTGTGRPFKRSSCPRSGLAIHRDGLSTDAASVRNPMGRRCHVSNGLGVAVGFPPLRIPQTASEKRWVRDHRGRRLLAGGDRFRLPMDRIERLLGSHAGMATPIQALGGGPMDVEGHRQLGGTPPIAQTRQCGAGHSRRRMRALFPRGVRETDKISFNSRLFKSMRGFGDVLADMLRLDRETEGRLLSKFGRPSHRVSNLGEFSGK